MELEELKNAWNALNSRLEYTEKLNQALWKDRVSHKGIYANRTLLAIEASGLCVLAVCIPWILFILEQMGGNWFMFKLSMYLILFFALFGLVITIVKLYNLIQIDFSGNIRTNLYHINRYNVMINCEKIAVMVFLPVLFISVILYTVETKPDLWYWVFLVFLLSLLSSMCYWTYKKFYPNQIRSIQRSLEELKELEE